MSIVSFLGQIDWNFLPVECFPQTYDLISFKSKVNKHLLSLGCFVTSFAVCFWPSFSCNAMRRGGSSVLHVVTRKVNKKL